jgi:thiol-disulfide isomerase/thioredoxin
MGRVRRMSQGFKSALRAVIAGFAALFVLLAVNDAITAIHHGDYYLLGVNSIGYVLLAVVLALSITIAKLSDGHAWSNGLLAGIGMGVPFCIWALHTHSSDPRTWIWFLGHQMMGVYVTLVLLLLATSLWAQSASLWFGRRRLLAALVALGSFGLVSAIMAAGTDLIRFFNIRAAQAIQASTARTQVDMPLPPLALTAMDDKPISASALQGHITVVDFWATWCGACIAELPSLETVYKEYSRDPRVQFLLVDPETEGDTPEKINRFLQRRPISIPVAVDPGTSYFKLSDTLNTEGLPLLLVVDQRRHIRFRENGFESDNKTRRELHVEIDTLLGAK